MRYREELDRQLEQKVLEKQNKVLEEKKIVQTPTNIQENKKEMDTCYYVIKQEDKGYWDIADKILGNEKRWKQIQDMNKGLKSEELKTGQRILIPCK